MRDARSAMSGYTVPVFCLLLFGLSACSLHAGGQFSSKHVYPAFHVGVTGVKVTIQKGLVVTVEEALPDTPAAGRLEKGDVILKANGRPVAGPDPRVALGEAIGEAEAGDGKVVFAIRRGDTEKEVSLTVPVLGAYSSTWPLNCRKSAEIVRRTAEYTLQSGILEKGSIGAMLAGLFLLSTDDPRYLPAVREQACRIAAKPTVGKGSHWPRGYQGILMAEYYLKTGDESVLEGIKTLCDGVVSGQAAGGWAHGGFAADLNGGYVQSGLMNPAGVPILTALILARECGVDVHGPTYLRALVFFYRMAGHGHVCYGDHRSELMWPGTNGKNGMLACALSLQDEEPYRLASQHMALLMADSYYAPEFGHTGGGFNVIWRGLGSVHVSPARRANHRRQQAALAWYYDLCRLPGGGFSMLPSPPNTTRYCGPEWGSGGVGLAYTAPRRTLRITGAPRSKHGVKRKAPALPWGRPADLAFLRSDFCEGYGADDLDPEAIHDRVLKGKDVPVALCAKLLRHYSPAVRIWASRKMGNSPAAIDAIAEALRHPDPRVRRAGMDCISLYDNWSRSSKGSLDPVVVSEKLVPLFVNTLTDDRASFWEIDGALYALGRAGPETVREHLAKVEPYLRHEEWWLRESAFWCLVGLHGTMKDEEFRLLLDTYSRETQIFARSSYDGGFRQLIRGDKLPLGTMRTRVLGATLGESMHSAPLAQGLGVPAKHEAAHRAMMVSKHCDPALYLTMVGDLVKYLETWEPYHQHSVWLITGSKWQPGVLKVLEGLGKDGEPLCRALKRVLDKYERFDRKRFTREAPALEPAIRDAVEAWDKAYAPEA